jgi:hypothetical protein
MGGRPELSVSKRRAAVLVLLRRGEALAAPLGSERLGSLLRRSPGEGCLEG